MRNRYTTIVCILMSLLTIQLSYAADRYWVNGSGKWSDPSHWAESSGGLGGASVPTINDNVMINDQSSSQPLFVVTIDQDVFCNGLVVNATKGLSLFSDNKVCMTIAGSLIFGNGIINQYKGKIIFKSSTENSIICKTQLNSDISFEGKGSWNLMTPMSTSGNVIGSEKTKGKAINKVEVSIPSESLYGKSSNALYQPLAPLAIDGVVVTDVTSPGGSDGKILVNASGGVTPYTYSLYKGAAPIGVPQLGNEFTGLSAANNYHVFVLDDLGDLVDLDFIVVDEPSLAITFVTRVNPSCNLGSDGQIRIQIIGSFSPFTYEISNNGGVSWTTHVKAATKDTFYNLSAGSYLVRVTDNTPFTTNYALNPVVVSDPAILTITTTPVSPSCVGDADGQITYSGGGGTGAKTYDYSSNGGVSWTASAASPISGLAAGNYIVRVTDSKACTKSNNVTVSDPAALSLSATPTHPSCPSTSDGEIAYNGSGGTGALSYDYSSNGGATWTASASSPITGLAAGNYIVRMTDSKACTKTVNVSLTDPTALSLSTTPTSPLCVGNSNGEIAYSASGGTGLLSYDYSSNGGTTWTASASSPITGLAAGNYIVRVTDAKSCNTTDNVSVSDPPALTITTTPTNPLCNGGSTGQIAYSTGGGTGARTVDYSSNGGATWTASAASPITLLAAGNYIVRVTDGNACTQTSSVTLSNPAILTITTTPTNPLCNGGATGQIAYSTGGGTGIRSVDYSSNAGATWTASAASPITLLAAGNYIVRVTDANACTQTSNVTLSNPAILTITTTPTNPLCNGAATGQIAYSTGGGTGVRSVDYSSNGGATWTASAASPITLLAANNYIVRVTDANACTQTSNVTLSNPAVLTISTTPSDPLCNGAATGQIAYSTGGGTGARSVDYSSNGGATWTASAASPITLLAAGNYVVRVTDANACNQTANVTLSNPPVLTITTTPTNPLCNGGATGQIAYSTGGGIGAKTVDYSSNGGATWTASAASPITLLAAGNYIVRVTDANLCTQNSNVTLTDPAILTITTTPTNPLCSGVSNGQIAYSTGGGTGIRTVDYSSNAGATWTASASSPITGLGIGNYIVRVTDANACTQTSNVSLSDPTALTISATPTNPLCNGSNDGQIAYSGSGGTGLLTYDYSSNGGTSWTAAPASPITGLLAGNYIVRVTDANACTVSDNAALTNPAVLTLTSTPTDPLCNGESTGQIAYLSGGGTGVRTHHYSSNGGATWTASAASPISGLAAGSFIIRVTDGNACTQTSNATLNNPALLTITTTGTNPTCNAGSDGQITYTTGGGTGIKTVDYSSNGGATWTVSAASPIAILSDGNYIVRVTDANACFKTSNVTLTSPSLLTITGTPTDPSCAGLSDGQIAFSSSGGTGPFTFDYSSNAGVTWSSASSPITNLAAGNYIVRVTDSKLCTDNDNVTINDPAPLTATITKTDITTCFGASTGRIQITLPSGGSGTYQYTINGGTNWALTNDYLGLTANTYNVQMRDAANPSCVSILNSNLVVNQPGQVTFTAVKTDPTCFGQNNGTITVTAGGGTPGYTYSRNGGVTYQASNVFSPLSPANYNIRVKDANNCLSTIQSVTISQPTQLLIPTEIKSDAGNICFGDASGSISITISGGSSPFEYSIDNGVTYTTPTTDLTYVFSNLAAGTYQTKVRDNNGCIVSGNSNVISQPADILITITTVDIVTCFGDNSGIILAEATGGAGTLEYSIDGGVSRNTDGLFMSLTAGNYTVTVIDGNGCIKTAPATINEPPAITVTDLGLVQPSCNALPNGSINATVVGGTGALLYALDGGANQATGVYPAVGVGPHTLRITDANACFKDTTFTMTAPPAITIDNVTISGITCNGLTDGSIIVTASGGTGVLSYTLNPGAINNATGSFTNLAANTFDISVTDANLCPAATQNGLVVTEPAAITIDSLIMSDSICFGATNGYIRIYAIGGTKPFEYTIDNGTNWDTDSIFNSLSPSTYHVKVRDANLCENDLGNKDIEEYPDITATAVPTDVSTCFGAANGQIVVNPLGGRPAYQFSINGGTSYQASNTFASLPAAAYTIIVRDSKLCTENVNATVAQPSKINMVITPTHVVNGNDGEIDVTASGGTGAIDVTIDNWVTSKPAPANFNGLSIAKYYVKARDVNMCEVIDSVELQDMSNLIITSVKTDPKCFGEKGTITITSPNAVVPINFELDDKVNPVLNNTTGIFNNLDPATYYIIAIDAKPDTAYDTVVIAAAPSQIVNSITSVNVNPPALGSIEVAPTGGTGLYQVELVELALVYNTIKTPDTARFINLNAGSYTIKTTDANGCSINSNVTIVDISLYNVTIDTTDVLCNGANDGTITITVNGGLAPYNYSVVHETFGAQVPVSEGHYTNLRPGSYAITVNDAGSNTYSQTVVLKQPSPLTFSLTKEDVVGANLGKITITPSGGTIPYEFSNDSGIVYVPANEFSNLSVGWYDIAVRDANGCIARDSIEIEQGATGILTVIVDSVSPGCPGASDGHIYFLVLDGTEPILYSIDDGATFLTGANFDNLFAGTYDVFIKDVMNKQFKTQIKLNTAPEITVISDIDSATCKYGTNDGAIRNLNVNGGTSTYSFVWKQSSGIDTLSTADSLVNVAPGDYTLNIKDSKNCLSTQYFTIHYKDSVDIFVPDTVNFCFGDTARIIAIGTPQSIKWTGNFITKDTLMSVTTIPLMSPYSYVSVHASKNSCTFDQGITLIAYPEFRFDITTTLGDTVVSKETGTVLSTDITQDIAITYWITPCIDVQDSCVKSYGTFYVTPQEETEYTITIKTLPKYGLCEYSSKINLLVAGTLDPYTAFTPNEDGKNDYWVIKNGGSNSKMIVNVFNRWGEEVYSKVGCSEPTGNGNCNIWNGLNNNGKPVPVGVYYYVIDPGDGARPISGTVTIAR